MKITITCDSLQSADYIYDLLTTDISGCCVLSGCKTCIDEHPDVPDILTFDLTKEELLKVKQLTGVNYTTIDDERIKHKYIKKEIVGAPKIASYNNSTNNISHSLYYCQNYNTTFTQESPTNGTVVSLSTIDCSNVDIIVLDSGVDASHPDFLDNDGLTSRVVNFDWTQLKSGDPITGSQIVAVQQSDYYQDHDGHGTSCASLAAGNRCGFAANAKIYALRSSGLDPVGGGFSTQKCVLLALAFQRAKKRNLYGLDSTRPTVFTNSWGYVGPYIAMDLNWNDHNTSNLSNSVGPGKGWYYSELGGISSTVDSYFRSIISEGVHTFVAAGNENIYLTNNPVSSINVHCFRRSGFDFVTVRTTENNTSYTLNQTYGNIYKYGSTTGTDRQTRYFYTSPNIGLNFNKNDYPIHIIGDIIPIGFNDDDADVFYSGANAKTAYKILSGITTENRILTGEQVRYNSVSGPFFIKSAYSNFGPDVDVYTPGNGAWAALSNQVTSSGDPEIHVNSTQRYQFFNGTSSACPIAAGILATYLAENPSATPKQAYDWMQNNSVNGNIMQTEPTTLPVVSYNGTAAYTLNMPFGSNLTEMNDDPSYRLNKTEAEPALYNTGNVADLLFCNRFFNSTNKIAQAYPLRKAVLSSNNDTEIVAETVLTKGNATTKNVTHS